MTLVGSPAMQTTWGARWPVWAAGICWWHISEDLKKGHTWNTSSWWQPCARLSHVPYFIPLLIAHRWIQRLLKHLISSVHPSKSDLVYGPSSTSRDNRGYAALHSSGHPHWCTISISQLPIPFISHLTLDAQRGFPQVPSCHSCWNWFSLPSWRLSVLTWADHFLSPLQHRLLYGNWSPPLLFMTWWLICQAHWPIFFYNNLMSHESSVSVVL